MYVLYIIENRLEKNSQLWFMSLKYEHWIYQVVNVL